MPKASGGLTRWFSEEWVDLSRPKKGGGFEPCGRPDAADGKYPKCVPKAKAMRMSQAEIESAIRRKRRAESTQQREGQKPINVSTFKKNGHWWSSLVKGTGAKNIPADMELYNRVKAEAKRKFDVYPSAYANGWLVQEYKRRGGTYKTVEKQQPTSSDVHVPSTDWKKKKKRRELTRKKMRMDMALKKGGSGSGENPGHRYRGNQHDGGIPDAAAMPAGVNHGSGVSRDGFKKASASDIARIEKELGKKVPPAWTDVIVSKDKAGVNGCVLMGTAANGKDQYWYSKEHEAAADAAKWARTEALDKKLSRKGNKLDAALEADCWESDDAAALMLIRKTGMRVGGPGDGKAKVKAYGATTLEGRHVRVNKESVTLTFTGKGGKQRVVKIKDPLLRDVLADAKEVAGPRGRLFPNTSATRVGIYFKSKVGPEFVTKDLRTHKGTSVAAALVQGTRRPPTTMTQYKKMRNEVGDLVAEQLGNTRTMALNKYINPAVFAPWLGGLEQ